METILLSVEKTLQKDARFSGDELESMGIFPTNLQCFSYYNYVLYQQGNKRIILEPLPRNMFKVLRVYEFIPA